MGKIYFYSHTRGDLKYLSNFYHSRFVVDGHEFTSSEQYFMYRKALTFGDEGTAKFILKANFPDTAKKLGRKVKNYDDEVWSDVGYGIMVEALTHKFSQNPDLADLLRDTGDETLVEASPYDRKWGIGLSVEEAEVGKEWRGLNLLGKALMEVRSKL